MTEKTRPTNNTITNCHHPDGLDHAQSFIPKRYSNAIQSRKILTFLLLFLTTPAFPSIQKIWPQMQLRGVSVAAIDKNIQHLEFPQA